MTKIKVGDRIKLLVPTISGWMGYGTAMEISIDGCSVRFVKDGDDKDDWLACQCFCGIAECRKARRPNQPKDQA